jgi:AAA domain, putative AbiEii toxin, Type IV TA system/AAA domain
MENGSANGAGSEQTGGKPRLVSLEIHELPGRNVEPCTLRFNDGFNVLLGLNATGKTTLLELIAAALSFDFSKFKDEPFSIAYELAFSTGTIVVSMRNERTERPAPEMPVLQGRDAARLAFSAKLQVHMTSPPQTWTVCADMSSVWIEERQSFKYPLTTSLGERRSYLLSWTADIAVNKSLMETYRNELWPWEDARRFDEALDMFRDVTSPATWLETRLSSTSGAVSGFNVAGALPADILRAVGVHVVNMSAGSQGLTIPQESLDFLREIGALFGFRSARLEMRLENKAGGRAGNMLKFSDLRFMFETPDGAVIRHDDLSYGQKRLLAFYYYLAASPLTVIADELVDGLHHLWIDAAITAIGDRQAFLASQNPLLLDHLEFDSAEKVASTFITCRSEPRDDGKHMFWSNMSTYDAERFFRAYQVDVQHVSEILLSKGLW